MLTEDERQCKREVEYRRKKKDRHAMGKRGKKSKDQEDHA